MRSSMGYFTAKTFDEIMEESRKRRFVFVLDGIEANILLLVLDVMANDELPRVFEPEASESVREMVDRVRDRLRGEIWNHRFITLEGLEDAAYKAVQAGANKLGGGEIRKIIEETYAQESPRRENGSR